MDPYYTQVGPRDDLAAIEVNPPEGYIGERILPTVPVSLKSGTIYYATVTADSAAQTGRSVATAPTTTQISDSSTTFTAVEVIKRAGITPDEAKTMGGIEKADMVGAKWAKRQVMAYKEGDIRTLILGGTASNNFDPGRVTEDVQTAFDALRLYEGRTALISSTMTLKRMVRAMIADVQYGPVFARLISGGSPAQAAMGMNFEAWKTALAMFLGVDEVLAGTDEIWNATAVQGRFAVTKLDDGSDELSHKWKPVLGKVFQFLPEGKNPWSIQANANRDTINNTYDATLWYDAVILNSAATYLFDGVA